MKKHSMAIGFALIGLGVAGFATGFSTVGIICGLGLGAFIGYFVAGLTSAKGNLLQQDFISMGNLAGKTLDEIKAKVGEPNAINACTVADTGKPEPNAINACTVADTGKPGSLCTWTSSPYSITLLFDENNICLGVNKEIRA